MFLLKVVITLTTILITLDTIKSQPRAFESFVEVLFEVIAKLNEPTDKLLRQTVRAHQLLRLTSNCVLTGL